MQCPLAPFQLIIVICLLLFTLTFDASHQSEILIIRHGRSRSRHSIEKDHARWGLKALTNLTLVEGHDGSLEFPDIDSNTELNILNFHVNNKGNVSITNSSSSKSSEWNGTVGSFEINFTHNPNPKANGDGRSGEKQTNFDDWVRQQRTTEMPKSDFLPSSSPVSLLPKSTATSSPTKQQHRSFTKSSKDISRTHGNGIEGAHEDVEKEHKNEIMLDIKNTVDKGIQYLKSHGNLNEIKIEINDFHSARVDDDANVRRRERNKIAYRTQFIPVAVKMDQTSHSSSSQNPSNQQQQHQPKQRHQQRRLIHDEHQQQQANEIKINGGKELGIVTILTSQSHQDTRNNAYSHRHPTKQLKSHSPHATSISSDMSQQQQHSIVDGIDSNSNLADVFYVPSSTEEPMLGDQAIHLSDEMKSSDQTAATPFDVDKSLKEDKNAAAAAAHSHAHADTSQHDDAGRSHDNVNSDAGTTVRAKENNSEVESIQNDEENTLDAIENINSHYYVEDIEGEPIEVEEYHQYDENLDETSKRNRQNLKRGRDVVTQFLKIVESQHSLGGNCTAGTETNLGEGVVDRYAQDRFRVEAEVAVNRANMLTR